MSEQDFETFGDKYSNPDGIHHYEVTTSSGKTTGDGLDDYSHKIEVNDDVAGRQTSLIENMNNVYKIRKEK